MNELVKKGFEWLERYWHKKAIAFIAPFAVSAILLCFFYSPQTNVVSTIGWLSAVVIGVVVGIIWFLTNRLPRVKKGNAGIVIGILCDNPEEDKQVKVDFIANLRQLIQQGGARFELIELPSWTLDKLESPVVMNQLLQKVRGHFLLYGRVRLRNKDGKPAHLLAFEGMVRHRPVPNEVSQELSVDFTRVLPRRVIIERENDAFSFEATSEWTDVSTRYIVGMAALISGDVGYAENLFLNVQSKLKRDKNSNSGIKEISRRLPARFRQLYAAWLFHLYQAYFSTRNRQYVIKSDEICSKLLQYEPTNVNGMMVKAICEFVLRQDIPAAHKLITRCRTDLDNTWRYSRAFLHAYQGKMEEAVADYKHAFNGPVRDKSVPVQCEEFIQIVLAEEPERIQLHFCLGLINFYAKQDYLAAERDLSQFLAKLKAGEFPRQATLARELISDCQANSKKPNEKLGFSLEE
jgi:tetratricopeptide (TPR) repeat protein